MTSVQRDESWGGLATIDEEGRREQMTARYLELTALAEEERRVRLRAMAEAEYALPDAELRAFTLSRLQTWLALDHDKARIIASSYDAVMQGMAAPVAMRRVGLVQTLGREFSAADEDRLRDLVPAVFGGAPRRVIDPVRSPGPVELSPKRKPWWAFWQKS